MTMNHPDHVPETALIDFDLAEDPALRADPQARLTELLVDDPRDILYSPRLGGFWIVKKLDYAREVLNNGRLYSSYPIGLPPNYEHRPRLIPLEIDPPEHLRYRRLIMPAFQPAAVNPLEERIRARAGALLDAFLAPGRGDFHWGFAKPFPTGIFLQQMGLDEALMQEFWDCENGFYRAESPEERMRCAVKISEHLSRAVEEHVGKPRDDLVSMLLETEVEGEKLSRAEVDATCYLLFLAGVDTVATMLSFIFRYLALNPAVYARIAASPETMADSAEELLRMHAFLNLNRVCTQDTEFHGVTFKAGDCILVPTFVVDRDAAVYACPHEFRPDRPRSERNVHQAFGSGGHKCAGIHLARLEVRIALEEFCKRVESLRIPADAVLRAHGGTVMGYDDMPLEWTLRAPA
jgi:cytochrome P450